MKSLERQFERLGPGSAQPAWMETLDRACFGEEWGTLGEREWALALPSIAYALWSVIPALGEAELLRVAVEPTQRRDGLGRRLLKASEHLLRDEGVHTLLLEVRISNEAARALYESLGWKQNGMRKAYYKDGEDAALYRKELG